jgi:hypothetical protein
MIMSLFILSTGLVVLIELLLEFGSIWKFLPIIFVNLLPDIPEFVLEDVLEFISVDIESLVVVDKILEFE